MKKASSNVPLCHVSYYPFCYFCRRIDLGRRTLEEGTMGCWLTYLNLWDDNGVYVTVDDSSHLLVDDDIILRNVKSTDLRGTKHVIYVLVPNKQRGRKGI